MCDRERDLHLGEKKQLRHGRTFRSIHGRVHILAGVQHVRATCTAARRVGLTMLHAWGHAQKLEHGRCCLMPYGWLHKPPSVVRQAHSFFPSDFLFSSLFLQRLADSCQPPHAPPPPRHPAPPPQTQELTEHFQGWINNDPTAYDTAEGLPQKAKTRFISRALRARHPTAARASREHAFVCKVFEDFVVDEAVSVVSQPCNGLLSCRGWRRRDQAKLFQSLLVRRLQ